MKMKLLFALSAFADKIDLDLSKVDLVKGGEEVGIELLNVIIKNLHKGQEEFIDMVAAVYNITPEEALEKDAIDAIKDIINDGGVQGFLSQGGQTSRKQSGSRTRTGR